MTAMMIVVIVIIIVMMAAIFAIVVIATTRLLMILRVDGSTRCGADARADNRALAPADFCTHCAPDRATNRTANRGIGGEIAC
jgi:hypothetical protein